MKSEGPSVVQERHGAGGLSWWTGHLSEQCGAVGVVRGHEVNWDRCQGPHSEPGSGGHTVVWETQKNRERNANQEAWWG